MRKAILGFLGLTLIFLIGCNDDTATTRVVVRLTDSPGDYEQVNIDLQSVQVHADDNDDESGWITLDANPGIYDLLELTDGVETVIADGDYPAGRISQIRLILGDNNTVVVDGETFDLDVPSSSQSGLKLNLHEELTDGITYSVLLDFDAAKSVVHAGNSGKYILKPVIKAVSEALDGAIQGTVIPAEEGVAVYAIVGEDTLSTSYAVEGNSDFFLGGLPEGSYLVSFDPGDSSDYLPNQISEVSVSLGEITNIGETELVQ